MKIDKKLAVLMLAGIVVAAAFMATAQADDDAGKVKLKLACTAPGGTLTVTNGGNATVAGNCTVNGNVTPVPVPLSSDVDIKIDAAAGVNVAVNIIDATGNHKYKIKGDKSNDSVVYADAAGKDTVDLKGDGGTDSLSVTDDGGNDKYMGKDIDLFSISDAPGDKDKIEIN